MENKGIYGLTPLSPLGEDANSISSAIGRTPAVNYEILSITVFPTNDIPMAARVRVNGFILFLCHSQDQRWHVFRIARYRDGVVQRLKSIVYGVSTGSSTGSVPNGP